MSDYEQQPEPEMDGEMDDEEQDPSTTYWADLDDPQSFADEALARIESYYDRVTRRGIEQVWRAAYRAAFGLDENGSYHKSSTVTFGGERGELALVKVNQYRSLARHVLTLTTKNRPQSQARAANTDHRSLEQAMVADGVVSYFEREKGVESARKEACEMAIHFGEGFVAQTWDSSAGDETASETGEAVAQGDLVVRTFGPMDVIRDLQQRWGPTSWCILRTEASRWDLAAQYPELKDKILAFESPRDVRIASMSEADLGPDDKDKIALYELYHPRTPACPNGRISYFSGRDLVYFDQKALPYRTRPVHRMAPANFFGSSLGYTEAWDCIGLQRVLDSMYSTFVTNLDAHGVQNVVMETGTELDKSLLGKGAVVWEIPRGAMPPQGITLAQIPEGIGQLITMTIQFMETMMGVNAAARGNMDAIGKQASGSFMAFLHAMAIEYNSGLQESYAQLVEETGTGLVQILQAYADHPRLVSIAGVDNSYALRQFTGSDIELVDRVVVEPGNPILRNSQGRWDLAMMLIEAQAKLQIPFFKRAEQIITVLKTGNIDVMLDPGAKNDSRIRQENELLARGPAVVEELINAPTGPMPLRVVPDVRASRLDGMHIGGHQSEILAHADVLASPEARRDPAIVAAVLAHIGEHEWLEVQEQLQKQGLAMLAAGGMAPAQGPPPGNGGNGGGQTAEMAEQGGGGAAMPAMPPPPNGGPTAPGGM